MRFDVHPTAMKQKTGCALRTHPAKSHRQQRYVQQGVPRRERAVPRCWGHDEPALSVIRFIDVVPLCNLFAIAYICGSEAVAK